MVGLKDLTELLDKVPLWKRLKETPDKVVALEKRVAALENLFEKAPGEACPACGERQMRRTWASDMRGSGANAHRNETWTCQSCGVEEQRTAKATT